MNKALRFLAVASVAGSVHAFDVDDAIDRLDDTVRVTAFDDQIRARLSGLLDLEAYHFSDAPTGLADTTAHSLFNPRLTMLVDAQMGDHVYAFAQGRIDRGFDPSDNGARGRLDEYALRVTPWKEGWLTIQVGQFATVAGNWIERHLSWDNPFVNAPLPYENVTTISDIEVPLNPYAYYYPSYGGALAKYEYLPLIWGPSYATGVSVSGRVGRFDYALEMKNASLSSRPEVWRISKRGFSEPTFTGHVAFRPNEMWNFGLSASEGAYLQPDVEHALPTGRGIGDYDQIVLGQDVSFAWHHWQLWAEVYEVRFQLPRIGNADTVSYYVEAKYKLTPQLSAAVRWNQQFFGTVPDGYGNEVEWGRNVSRIEAAVAYRLTRRTQVKVQYGVTRAGDSSEENHTVAGQFTVRF